jgi:hypothetical protein
MDTNSEKLTPNELKDIAERVRKVKSLVRKSADAWLEAAKEVATAKGDLTRLAFERFCTDAGFTKSVADKLIRIGKCDRLYQREAGKHIGAIDGWSTLYEVSKLEDHQITELWDKLESKPSLPLSRSVVQELRGSPGGNRTLVFLTIEGQEGNIDRLTRTQIEDFEELLWELKGIFRNLPTAFVMREHKPAIEELAKRSIADPAIEKEAA